MGWPKYFTMKRASHLLPFLFSGSNALILVKDDLQAGTAGTLGAEVKFLCPKRYMG